VRRRLAIVDGAPRALKVCLIAPVPPPYGGMSVQAALLADRLRGEGADVQVLATNPGLPTGCAWLEVVPGVRTLLREILFCVRLLPAVRRADVVHHLAASHLYFVLHSAPAILACRLSGTRIVLNYRGGDAPTFLRRYRRLLVPLIRLADAVVVPSGFLERVFRRYGIEVAVIPNVADIEAFTFEPRTQLRPRLIVTRALEPMYNVEGVLRAFRRVQQHYPEAALGIVGAGSQAAHLRDLVREWKLQHVRFHGWVARAELPGLYCEYDVCINASLVDNFPGSLVEAACCGLPIVTSGAGGIPDMIRHRNTGMLCRVHDDAQLADGVIEVLRTPMLAAAMARNARCWAEQFAWSRVSPQVLRCYRGPGGGGHAEEPLAGGAARTPAARG
jgi:glycosyltransferase involved in cell wall biosynthesis